MKKILIFGLILLSLNAFSLTSYEIKTHKKEMTEAQWKKYAKTLPGQKITWEGTVEEVTKNWLQPYEIRVEMDGNRSSHTMVTITDVPKKIAESLDRETKIKFSGTIKRLGYIGDALGIVDVIIYKTKITNR